MKPVIGEECLCLFDNMTGDASALIYKDIESSFLRRSERILFASEVPAVERGISADLHAFKRSNCFGYFVHGDFFTAFAEHVFKHLLILGIAPNDFENGLMIF